MYTTSIPGLTVASERGWIHSRTFDLCCFVLSPVVGLVVVAVQLHSPQSTFLLVAATYLIGIPHYLATFTFYLGDDNRAYYWSRRVAFFCGPLVITAAVMLLRLWQFHAIVQVTMFVWNIYHVSLQSSGILSLYRRLHNGPDEERRWARWAILAVNATMAVWYVDRFRPLFEMLRAVHPACPQWLRLLCLTAALWTMTLLVHHLWHRPKPLALPEWLFLMTSLLLFHPYLWVRDAQLATFGMLVGHFIQYLAIVWLLHYRKYATSDGSSWQRTLGWISRYPPLVYGVIVVSGTAVYLIGQGATLLGIPVAYTVFWNTLALSHFYLDGLIWAFKRPFVRQSLGPYLTLESHRVLP